MWQVHLTSTGSSSLPKAKIKTLKMTLVIVVAFILFGLPYFVAEMIMSYGDYKSLNRAVYALLGGVAPANSAANPYIFLLFSANMQVRTNVATARLTRHWGGGESKKNTCLSSHTHIHIRARAHMQKTPQYQRDQKIEQLAELCVESCLFF